MNGIEVNVNTCEGFKKMWERAIPFENAENLKKIIVTVTSQCADTLAIVYRNRSMLGIQ